jgi:hypothetical protein
MILWKDAMRQRTVQYAKKKERKGGDVTDRFLSLNLFPKFGVKQWTQWPSWTGRPSVFDSPAKEDNSAHRAGSSLDATDPIRASCAV